jgi:hypothetical protein
VTSDAKVYKASDFSLKNPVKRNAKDSYYMLREHGDQKRLTRRASRLIYWAFYGVDDIRINITHANGDASDSRPPTSAGPIIRRRNLQTTFNYNPTRTHLCSLRKSQLTMYAASSLGNIYIVKIETEGEAAGSMAKAQSINLWDKSNKCEAVRLVAEIPWPHAGGAHGRPHQPGQAGQRPRTCAT